MASVTKRRWPGPDGKTREAWMVRYTDAGGVRRGKQFDLKRDADKYRLKVEAEIETGAHIAPSASMTVEAVTRLYMASLEARVRDGRGLGRNSLEREEAFVRLHVVPHFGSRLLTELSFNEVEKWADALGKGRSRIGTGAPRVPSTVTAIIRTLANVVDFGMKRGFVSKNIVADFNRDRGAGRKESVQPFTKDEVLRIFTVLDSRMKHEQPRAGTRLRLFVHIAAFCGLRVGEINGLTLPCIDFERRVIRVRHNLTRFGELKSPKTKAGVRNVPMPVHVAQMLRDWMAEFYIDNSEQILFKTKNGRQFLTPNLRSGWLALCRAAGIETDPVKGERHFHALRHFAVSFWIENGLPVMEAAALLGHSHYDMTLQTYAHPISGGSKNSTMVDHMAFEMLPAKLTHDRKQQIEHTDILSH